MSTNLIDTYVSEVGRHLPGKTRSDIQAEIRSILQDMLDERSQKTGKPVDEQMTLEVLKEYGAPEKVAATYLGERYLIGPRLYPIFVMVMRIVLSVIGVLAAIGLGIALYQTTLFPLNAFEIIIKAIANFIASAFTGLGTIVLIFAILEWVLYRSGNGIDLKGTLKEKEWDPRSLARITPTNQIKVGEIIIEVVGCFVAIVLFNFYPQVFGIGTGPGGSWYIGVGNLRVYPLLSEAFFHFVPYLTLVWALTIILDIILLRNGTWNTLTRLCLIGLKVVNILIALAILAGPSLLALTTGSLTIILGNVEWARTLMTTLNQLVRVLLWITIIGNAIEIIRSVSRLATHNILPQVTGKG